MIERAVLVLDGERLDVADLRALAELAEIVFSQCPDGPLFGQDHRV